MSLPNPKTLDTYGVEGFSPIVAKSSLAAQGRGLDFTYYRTGAVLALGGGGIVQLAGTSTGSSSISAFITIQKNIAGTSTGSSTTTAALTVKKTLAGSAAGSTVTSAALRIGVFLEGSSTGTSSTSAALTVLKTFYGSSAGAGTCTATLVVNDRIPIIPVLPPVKPSPIPTPRTNDLTLDVNVFPDDPTFDSGADIHDPAMDIPQKVEDISFDKKGATSFNFDRNATPNSATLGFDKRV